MSMSGEKAQSVLPCIVETERRRLDSGTSDGKTRVRILVALACLVLWGVLSYVEPTTRHFDLWSLANGVELCPQVDVLFPKQNAAVWIKTGEIIDTEDFKARAVDWLAGAVKIPTELYDGMGPVGIDPRWNVFDTFHNYLLGTYPLVHATLALTKVNTHGLWYIWKGSNTLLKPILLAAHQDVVPVDPTTVNQWTYPPYSGHFDGQHLWGRGSIDDKGSLVGILSAIEILLENQFQPSRTIVLALGFDEEVTGLQGAGHLADALLEAYGEDAFAFIIDEGSSFIEQFGAVFAIPGVTEKGYLDVRVEVTSPGGHSSIPPSHTSIGILSSLLVEYENNPYDVHLARESPLYATMQCFAEHAPSLPPELREIIKRSQFSNIALRALEQIIFANPMYKSLAGTTQAIDLIQGGVKTNALPEEAWAIVNNRISTESSVDETKAHNAELLKSLASKFNLTYTAFGVNISNGSSQSSGTLTLSDAYDSALEPAPITPTGATAVPYQLLSGTIKATYNAHRALNGSNNIAVSPGTPFGNSDTQYYWKLSQHIFRYNHNNAGNGSAIANIHTVNECIEVDSFLEIIRFFTTLILNADEWTAL